MSVKKERRAIFNKIASTIVDLDKAFKDRVTDFSNIEKRLSQTLVLITRADTPPFVIDYSPKLLAIGKTVDVTVTGQNLQSKTISR